MKEPNSKIPTPDNMTMNKGILSNLNILSEKSEKFKARWGLAFFFFSMYMAYCACGGRVIFRLEGVKREPGTDSAGCCAVKL